jgi:hypothetical protein
MKDQLAKSRQRFDTEVRDHKMKVLRNDKVYRHLRFMNPRNGAYWFELHTGPHFLLFRGDGESYVFSNGDHDIFSSFRHSLRADGSIHPDPGYWTQKLASAEQAEKWDTDTFSEDLEQHITDMVEQEIVPKKHEARLRAEVENDLMYEDLHSADLAIKALMEFEFYFDERDHYDSKKQPDFTFEECWEWVTKCTEYDWWYLWALHGIVWGIGQYDRKFGRPGVRVDAAKAGVQIG